MQRQMQRPGTSHSVKINEQIRKQLLPRTDKLKQMIGLNLVPQSCQNKVIVPCLQKTLGFKTNQFVVNKSLLEGYITRLQFNGFVRKCNKVVQQEVIRKTNKQNESFFGIISVLLKISIVIAILTFFLLATLVFSQLEDQTQNIILILAGVLLASASMIAVICPVVLYTSKYQTVNYEQAIKSRLKQITEIQNDALIKKGKKYLAWNVETNFFWIQLNIDPTQELQDQDVLKRVNEDDISEEASAHNFLQKKSDKPTVNYRQQLVKDT